MPLTDPPLIDGVAVPLTNQVATGIDSYNYFADVTSAVKPTLDSAPAVPVAISVAEPNPSLTEGEILEVIYDDPSVAVDQTVSILYGALNPSGDSYNVMLTAPIAASDPTTRLEMSLGISYSYQDNGTPQYSMVDVNGQRLTTAAGGEDDGAPENGQLLTVGGDGDSTSDPVDPNATPAGPSSDDELYDLRPFVSTGDTSIQVNTSNPSHDDNVFLATFTMNPPVSGVSTSGGGGSLTVNPTDGPPGTVFTAKWQCGTGPGQASVKATDGLPLQDVSQGLTVSLGGEEYSQDFQVGPDGAYEFELLCDGTTTDLPFKVVAKSYVAMGDSYSSGEGASSFDPATDIPSTNLCHRGNTDTWTISVAGYLGLPRDFAACSGDVIPDITQYSDAHVIPAPPTAYPKPTPPNDLPAGWPEIPQLDHVSRLGTTKLVTITISGNDIGFPSILRSCIFAFLNRTGGFGCAQRDQKLLSTAITRLTTGWKAGCYTLPGVDPNTGKTPQICSSKDVPSLHALYEKIARLLPPGSKVEVVGYPRLFGKQTQFSFDSPTHRACKVRTADGFNAAVIGSNDVAWLNAQAFNLNSTIGGEALLAQSDLTAAGVKVSVNFIDVDHVLDPRNESKSPFYTHRICDTGTPYFHGAEFEGTPFPRSKQLSFHPNDDGQRAYASAVKPKL
jgi:lysophospholipase L1-like esterase